MNWRIMYCFTLMAGILGLAHLEFGSEAMTAINIVASFISAFALGMVLINTTTWTAKFIQFSVFCISLSTYQLSYTKVAHRYNGVLFSDEFVHNAFIKNNKVRLSSEITNTYTLKHLDVLAENSEFVLNKEKRDDYHYKYMRNLHKGIYPEDEYQAILTQTVHNATKEEVENEDMD